MPNPARLQMIQAIITRLAGNSGTLKGFAITLMTALIGVSINTHRPEFAFMGAYVAVALGLLDAYYLSLERLYRNLYSRAITESEEAWGLETEKPSVGRLLGAITSPSVSVFYGAALAAALIVAYTAKG